MPVLDICLPNGDAHVEQWSNGCHGSNGCMRCCDTLDWTNQNVPGVAKEGQPTEEIEAQS